MWRTVFIRRRISEKEIFEPDEDGNDDGKKYFDYLRTHVENIE